MSFVTNKDHVKHYIIERCGGRGYLLGHNLVAKLESDTGLDTMSVRDALRALAKENWLNGVAINSGLPVGRVSIIGEIPVQPVAPSLARWSLVMKSAGLIEQDTFSLEPCHEKLHDMNEDDMARLIRGLLLLRNEQDTCARMPKFVVSAKYLLGSSKIIGNLPAKALRNFGIDISQFLDSPSYVMVAGCSNPKAVLLIENPHAFETAVESGAANKIAMIATYGYGLSRSDDSFGKQLAEIIESGKAIIPLVRAGNPPPVQELFAHDNMFFWGDADAEGIRIFERLKTKLPQLELSGLHRVMQELTVDHDKSHPYVAITGKENQKQDEGNKSQYRAVDQEAVTAAQIEKEFDWE